MPVRVLRRISCSLAWADRRICRIVIAFYLSGLLRDDRFSPLTAPLVPRDESAYTKNTFNSHFGRGPNGLPADTTSRVTSIAALGALAFSFMNYLHSRRTLHETRVAERRKTILAKLNEFYGPS